MSEKIVMPKWGPYSKKYMGISRTVDSLSAQGARLDFITHPTLWNSSTPVPNVTVPSSYHLWECSNDYSFYSYRYELMWKDMVYADVSYSKINDEAYLMRCEFVNNTKLSQNCILNIYASLEFPSVNYIEVEFSSKHKILSACEYSDFEYFVKRPWDEEMPDGMFKGTFRDDGFYKNQGLGDRCDNKHVSHLNLKPFAAVKGDKVKYSLTSDGIQSPVLVLRYRTVTEGDARFMLGENEITLPHSDSLTLAFLPFCENPEFVSLGTAGVEFDFLAVVQKGCKVDVLNKKFDVIPKISSKRLENAVRTDLLYNYNDCSYSILTHNPNTRQRILESGSLEDALINRLSNGDPTYDDLKETFSASFKRKTSDEGFFHNTVIKSIFIEPFSSHTEYAVLSKGVFSPLDSGKYEKIYEAAKSRAEYVSYNESGEKYSLSTNILKSTLLTNVVYPVYRHGENIVHHAPGKRWDSFYTWDSGFIGMGLLEYSPKLCLYVLDTYLCDESNKDFCFLLHGSLVPTQFEEYLELLKRTDDKHSLDFLYDKMKRYYEFLRGRTHGSTCNKFSNGLLTVYDYWYSCSGMDDYPAQVKMIADKAEDYSCPCLTTAQVIRAGKIMKMVADYLGKSGDSAAYDADIAVSEKALNDLAWDEESGYFGYTLYDKDKPYIMKTESGENWNKGFDGIYPLISGSVSGERRQRLIGHIKNPDEMWSAAGISAVDMSASYYFDDGYWNGNVWMSHQWFIWKTMLDNAQGDFAFEIANRALDMWKEETDFSYYTYECFGIATKRGGWFHNFGGLSAPICIWANAYYKPGTVTTGFDVWTNYQNVTAQSAEISFKYYGSSDKYTMIVTLDDKNRYFVLLNGKNTAFTQRNDGCIEITLDGSVKNGIIEISAV